jgi:hypothetical protein
MYVENLTDKNIKDFEAGDSINATVRTQGGQFSTTYLCEFIEHVNDKKVKVKVIDRHGQKDNYTERAVRDQEEIEVTLNNLSLYGRTATEKRSRYHSIDANGCFFVDAGLLQEEDDEIPESHESYGMVGLSRYSSSGKVSLFGSPLQHKQCISLVIKRGRVDRSMNMDRYYGKEQLIEIDLSEAQFAELITSMNRGDGVPCTIKRLQGAKIEEPPYKSYADKLADEFKAKMHNISAGFESSMDSINQILEKKNVGKADKEEIKKHIGKINSFLNSSLPFVADQFQEQTDEVVSKAKMEVLSFINEAARKAGLESGDVQGMIAIDNE